MANQPWLDRVRERLARQALPSAYIERLTEELSDHLEQLKEDGMEANPSSRLGEPQQVVAAAAAAYRRRSFIGRHVAAAFAVFVISPVIVQYFLTLLGTLAVLMIRGDYGLVLGRDHWILSPIVFVVSTFMSILYCELAVRLGVGRRWMAVCCVMLSIMSALLEFAAGSQTVTPLLPVQGAVPLAVGWWFARRMHSPIREATKFFVFALSPVASYSFLWLLIALAGAVGQSWLNALVEFLAERFGTAGVMAWSFGFMVTTFIVPTVIASLLYCVLAGRFGIGNRWMAVSCVVLAAFAAAQASCTFAHSYQEQLCCMWIGMMAFVIPSQCLIPLAIGWWFARRRRYYAQLG
jgi:hypothetical protein